VARCPATSTPSSSYRICVAGENKPDVNALIEEGLSRGMQAVDALRDALDRMPSGSSRQLQKSVKRVNAANRASVRAHQLRVQQVKAATTVGGAGIVVGASGAVIDVATAGAFLGNPLSWLALAGLSAVLFAFGRRSARRVGPAPMQWELPAGTALPRKAIGAEAAARYVQARLTVINLAQQVQRLQPEAAKELLLADSEAAPALDLLVERLRVLDAVVRGTSAAAPAARDAARVISARLSTGCDSYENLIAAAATLLAAPDTYRSTEAILEPAINALVAYSHGLARAAQI
ncbi:MAG: hypothetical protein RJB01_82, partial [Actinomycetota bacterium]